jgi:cobalt-zinc-cadmium efflux system membrane fusion protein
LLPKSDCGYDPVASGVYVEKAGTMAHFLSRFGKFAVVAAVAAVAFVSRDAWLPSHPQPTKEAEPQNASTAALAKVVLSDAAIDNLGMRAKPIQLETAWKTIAVPGWITHRPGFSDRGVISPAAGVVASIHRVPGDTVRPGDLLFTVKLLSESLHLTQTELYRTDQDIAIAEDKLERLKKLATIGAESQSGIEESKAQIRRLKASSSAYRQELVSRGISPIQVDEIAKGKFVSEMAIVCPPLSTPARLPNETPTARPSPAVSFEIQELKAELGQQVQAGQSLCLLANHQSLAIEGKAFRDEMPQVERCYKEGWPVEVDLQEDAASGWGEFKQKLTIRYIANTIDPVHRTFPFLIPLENESKSLEREGGKQTLWRFRPGQRVRLSLRVEEMKDVYVVPADAVVQNGAEAFVFTQNVNTFERQPIRLKLLDRQRAVFANDGSLPPGSFVVQGSATQLQRIVQSTSGGGVPKGYHMHADGTLHKNDDAH